MSSCELCETSGLSCTRRQYKGPDHRSKLRSRRAGLRRVQARTTGSAFHQEERHEATGPASYLTNCHLEMLGPLHCYYLQFRLAALIIERSMVYQCKDCAKKGEPAAQSSVLNSVLNSPRPSPLGGLGARIAEKALDGLAGGDLISRPSNS